MTAYIFRRLLLVIPTLLGIMIINFAVVQIVPGGPVEQMIAQMTGTAVESTARFSGADLAGVGTLLPALLPGSVLVYNGNTQENRGKLQTNWGLIIISFM